MGVIFFAFSLASYLFSNTMSAWGLFLMGLALWIMAFGIFFSFMDHPYPRHRKTR